MKSVILDYAVERKGERQVVYQYDFAESLNVITIGNKRIAFIDSKFSVYLSRFLGILV